mgnify:CR=1 FL=1
MRGRIRVASSMWLGAALAGALSVTGAAAAGQDVDVSGTWRLTVTTDQGVTHPTVSLRQDGSALAGDYSSESLGEQVVEGSVADGEILFRFSAVAQGREFPVVYRGVLAADGTSSGTIDIAGGLLTGSFVGRREGG